MSEQQILFQKSNFTTDLLSSERYTRQRWYILQENAQNVGGNE